MLILSDLHIYILVISADSHIEQTGDLTQGHTAANSFQFIFPVTQLPFNPPIRMDREKPLTTFHLSAVSVCLNVCVCVFLFAHLCVWVCPFPSLFVCLYLSSCVCVFLVRSSAGGDYGGAGEEGRQHAGPHHLRRNRQGRETPGVEPTAWRAGSQVGATPENHIQKTFVLGSV